MEIVGLIFGLLLIVAACWFAVGIIYCGFKGAANQFVYSTAGGFIGVVVFFAAWVFIFPIMAIWAVGWGLAEFMDDWKS